MSSSTPSPTASATQNTSATNSASRRPPRKSTLTQQQKNQKRQRATQDQLSLLEVEFNRHPTPTAAVRERIAQEINMTERSVQIWFQNRRAKIKLLTKKSIETGEDCDAIPESYRNYLAHQALEGKPLARSFLGQPGGLMPAYGNGGLLFGAEHRRDEKIVIHHFMCKSLSIGTWRRVGQNAMDLVVFYSIGEKPCLTYYINNENAGYKIEFPFSSIKNITLDNGQSADGVARPAGLTVELNRVPNFYMDSNNGSDGFLQCGDFTEDQQASRVMAHHLGGDPRQLSTQLAHLMLLEPFQNRHNHHHPYLDASAIAASAPVSPVGNRPASQPNAMGPPPPHMNLFHDHGFGMSLHPNPRGHKRTRSRSVPAMLDFSMLHQPMPSFHVQHPSTTISDASIFAPIPQHHNNLFPGGHNLRINTTSGYDIDFRQHPMSAATTTSPSEYASPSFFSSGAHMDSMPAVSYNTNYGLPFLSPMPEHPQMLQQSVSPLSTMSHGDPVIANQSPPMANMPRSPSADMFSMTNEHRSSMSDEGLMLSEMYSKQTLNLPIRPAEMDDANLEMHLSDPHLNDPQPTNDEMELHSMFFGTVDPSNLSPGNLGL